MKHPGYDTIVLVVKKFKAGDHYAFALVFHIFYLDLCFFSKRILEKTRDAEELVEKIFIELWNSHKLFENLGEIKAYLFTATRDACFSYIDHRRRGILDEKFLELSAAARQEWNLVMEKEIIRSEIREIRYNPIENLPPSLKKIICQPKNN